MEIVIAATLVVMMGLFVAALLARRKANLPRRVDEYVLSVEEREGFRFVQMKIKTDDAQICTFELEAPYAHVLSDELCTTAAHAMKVAHAAG